MTLKQRKENKKKGGRSQLTARHDPSQLGLLLLKLLYETRSRQAVRNVLPALLRTKIEIVAPQLEKLDRQMTAATIQVLIALNNALSFKNLTASEKKTCAKMIQTLALNAAKRSPELVTAKVEEIFKSLFGESIKSTLKREVQEFMSSFAADPESVTLRGSHFLDQIKRAHSTDDIERLSQQARLQEHPHCRGKLEYFADLECQRFVRDFKGSAVQIQEALSIVKDFIRDQCRETVDSAADCTMKTDNVISFMPFNNGEKKPLTGADELKELDLAAALTIIETKLGASGLQEFIDHLTAAQCKFFIEALSSQSKILDLEIAAIASHPDSFNLTKYLGEYQELLSFNVFMTLQGMNDRTWFFIRSAQAITKDHSINAVRDLILDFQGAEVSQP
jgi:hypothetical protein